MTYRLYVPLDKQQTKEFGDVYSFNLKEVYMQVKKLR